MTTYSEAKKNLQTIISELNVEMCEAKEIYTAINCGEDDFEIGEYRIISSKEIDSIQEDELKSDEHILGCFNASFIAEVTGWPIGLIEAAQKGEAYSELGEAIIAEDYAGDLQKEYARLDGYGHHFNHYDGSGDEFTIDGDLFHAFRVNQ